MSTDIRRRLAELDAEILKHNTILCDLRQQRTDLRRELCAVATYPVLTLPVEITAEIFMQCLPDIDDRDIYTSALKTNMPILLMGVCQAWRDVALSTPMLWSTLDIHLDRIPDTSAVSTIDPEIIELFVVRWLSRAADCPLSLTLRRQIDQDWNSSMLFPSRRLRAIIHQYAPKIQQLALDMSEGAIRQLGPDSASFHILERATLGYPDAPEYVGPQTADIFLTDAPRFHDLRIIFLKSITNLCFPFHRLTKFEGEIVNLELFSLAPNLTELTCHFSLDADTEFILTHPRLESITLVHSLRGKRADDLFYYLTLPGLRSINVSGVYHHAYASLERFLERSSPRLITLSIRAADSTLFEWMGCVYQCGNTIENLELNVEWPSVDILSSIFTSFKFPKLRVLTLRNTPRNKNLLLLLLLRAFSTTRVSSTSST
ncbi:hypothetical protein B0H15DRAFT_586530 [Mycena belliarum]|uniref:F-box domain-containing protein n=1 Tax=Mycena belliarum TaxID=1033014 RepID=A0AAD6UET6_9AGAR|nr:hypothetical protein B0H15DRAFT_586530 [Mycena belliae]